MSTLSIERTQEHICRPYVQEQIHTPKYTYIHIYTHVYTQTCVYGSYAQEYTS